MGCHKGNPGIQADLGFGLLWFGFLNEGSRNRCQAVLNRLKRAGFLGEDFESFVELRMW